MRPFYSFIFVLSLCLCFKNVFAGPPFFTDDPEPVDYKHWEGYLAFQSLRVKNDFSGTVPQIEFNYGVHPNMMVHVVASGAFDKQKRTGTDYGLADTEFGIKYRFIQETDNGPQVGVFPLLEIPTGDSGWHLGTGETQVFLPLWLQKSWGSWTTYGGGGYWINPGTGNRNWVYLGWLLQRDLTKRITLGGEIFHRTPDTTGGSSSTGFNLGGQVNFDEHQHLLFSAGRDFSGPSLLTDYLAYQMTY